MSDFNTLAKQASKMSTPVEDLRKRKLDITGQVIMVSDNSFKKVDVLCVGAQKCATTSLHDLLNRYDDIALPRQKETKFFLRNASLHDYSTYHNYFDQFHSAKLRIEVDPDYLFDREAARKIYEYNPRAKIIIILRNPVARAYSHYQMTKRRGFERLSFNDAIKAEDQRICRSHIDRKIYSYKSRGLYYAQVKRYVELFGRDNVLVMDMSAIKDIQKFTRKLFTFMGLELVAQSDVQVRENTAKVSVLPIMSMVLDYRLWVKSEKLIRLIKFAVPDGSRRQRKIRALRSYLLRDTKESILDENVPSDMLRDLRKDAVSLDALLNTEFTGNWF